MENLGFLVCSEHRAENQGEMELPDSSHSIASSLYLLRISGLSSSEQPLSGTKGIPVTSFWLFQGKIAFLSLSPPHLTPRLPLTWLPRGFPTWTLRPIGHKQSRIKIWCLGTYLVVHWLSLCTFNAGEPGSIPGQGPRSYRPQLKTLHATTKIRDPVCFS